MKRIALVIVVACAATAGFLTRGWLAPLWMSEQQAISVGDHDDHDEHDEHDEHEEHEEEPHVPITEQAFETLGLRLEPVRTARYVQTNNVPAEVVEFPGVSGRKLTAPVSGEVTVVGAQLGAAVAPGQTLFEVRITDEQVIEAQLRLVESITELAIVEKELRRIEPLTASGAIRGRQRIDLDYQREQLATKIALAREELRVRGLTESQVEQLAATKKLLRTVSVSVPMDRPAADVRTATDDRQVRPVSWQDDEPALHLSVERLSVEPGQTVARGELLCDLADHDRLYLKGYAFESDLPLLIDLAKQQTVLSASFGHNQHQQHGSSELVSGLTLQYIGNEVETASRAYPFHILLENELLYETTDPSGYRYRTWRFTVGQRAHIRLPTKVIEGHLPLPVEAVAIDGVNAFVFVPHEDEHENEHAPSEDEAFDSDGDHHDDHEDDHDDDHDHEEILVELEPLPVTILYRDSERVVVASGGLLNDGDTIAMNAAHQLYQALHADSGGGHDHHHH